MKDNIYMDGQERNVRDVMNPVGMFSGGIRQREYSSVNDPLPMSGKLIPEFFGRRNIRDMFSRKPSLQQSQSASVSTTDLQTTDVDEGTSANGDLSIATEALQVPPITVSVSSKSSPVAMGKKRSVAERPTSKVAKRAKSTSTPVAPSAIAKGQQSLKGFFKPKAAVPHDSGGVINRPEPCEAVSSVDSPGSNAQLPTESSSVESKLPDERSSLPKFFGASPSDPNMPHGMDGVRSRESSPSPAHRSTIQECDKVHDPVETKESWSKLFTKPAAPRCEGHDEPCITLLTKKPGMNLGRSFWMCPRPLGPSGAKEKNTQWRCQTFIWCSDWNPNSTSGV